MVFYSFENTFTDPFLLDSQSNLMSWHSKFSSTNIFQLTQKPSANIILTGEH